MQESTHTRLTTRDRQRLATRSLLAAAVALDMIFVMHRLPQSEIKASGQTGNLAGIHLFSFGGFVDSANWIGERIARTA